MNTDIIAVDMNTLWAYDFARENETNDELLARANGYKESSNNNADYKVMSFDEYMQLKKERYLSDKVQEITEEEWEDKLNVLPPLYWCTIDGVNEFCLSEMYDDTFTTQYARYNGKYYSKMVDVADKRTWIHNFRKELV